jgi:hypothetical protein
MRDFLRYTGNLIFRPRSTLALLLTDPQRLPIGFGGILTLSTLYIIVISVTLARNPTAVPSVSPVLNVPPERYYVGERFFLLPVAVASVILDSGVVRLIAHCCRGRGKFVDVFALLGFGYVAIALVMGLPDLLIAALARQVSMVAPHVVIGTAWYLILSLFVVRETEGLSWGLTILIGLAGFIANASMQFVFMR